MGGHRLLLTALLVFIGTSFLAAIMQGGGGIIYTPLTQDVSANATVWPVSDTSLYNDGPDILRCGNEKALYSSKNATAFFISQRGYDDTTPEALDAGRYVYTTEAGVLNDAFGYNVGVSLETGGVWGLLLLPINFFTKTLPHLVVLNANLFRQGSPLNIIAIFWYGFGIALALILAINVAPIAINFVAGLFGLRRIG